MNVPFVDLEKQYAEIRGDLDPLLSGIFSSSQFILGGHVSDFEHDFARYCGVKHCVGVSSGTEALHLALLGQGIGPGAEVIVPTHSFFATAEAVVHAGAQPVFVDSDAYYTIDAEKISAAISPKTKAIIPVHLYGQCADLKPIREIAEKKSLVIIEDSAQAHGAEYHGKKAGSLGHASGFSFYPAKNLGAFGEAGAITTDDEDLAEKMRLLRAHGEHPKNHHTVIGYNYRMENIQGAVLKTKLKRLDAWNDARRKMAAEYTRQLKGLPGLILPQERKNAQHVYHLYVVQVENRDSVQEALAKKGIATAVHYTAPIHQQPVFSSHAYSLPRAEAQAKKVLSLPLFPHMTREQVDFVCAVLKEVLG